MSYRILVIDHRPQGLERVVGPLRQAGYEVAVARTAADGASSFGRFAPHLVFIAARLPRTHGTVLCRELKRTDAGARTPIVLIVESTEIQIDLPPLDQFGADRLIQKPVGGEELLLVCRELLEPEAAVPADEQSPGAADGDAGVDYSDNGLATALEELDTLEFDLPEEIVRRAEADLPPTVAVPVSDDGGADIESRIDDLFGGEPTPPPPPVTEPSTGQDRDADAALLDDLGLDEELNIGFGRAMKPPTPRRRATDRPAPPALPVPRPAPASPRVDVAPQPETFDARPAVGRFQTESLTRRVPVAKPAPAPQPAEPPPPRWIWAAIPVTVAIVAAGVFLMARRESPAPAVPVRTVTERAPAESRSRVADAFLSLATQVEPDESVESRDGDGIAAGAREADERFVRNDAAPPATVPDRRPTIPVEPAREETPAPAPSRPEPAEPAFASSPPPAIDETPPVVRDETPVAEAEPAPDGTPAAPEVPAAAPPPPITRGPILVQRVEPRIDPKDLKKGGGTVVLQVRVSENGTVSRVVVEQGLPGSPLEGAAVAAVLRWRYEPALDAGRPVEGSATARFDFDE